MLALLPQELESFNRLLTPLTDLAIIIYKRAAIIKLKTNGKTFLTIKVCITNLTIIIKYIKQKNFKVKGREGLHTN